MPEIMGETDENATKTIYLVRHGETAMNAQHLMRGWDDPDLNDEGRKDAEEVAQALKDSQIDSVFCSTLKRAVSTMQMIVKGHHPTINLTENLKTIDVGAWTGKPLTQVEPMLAKLQVKWRTDPDATCPHGESWTEFQGRQLRAWKAIVAAKGDVLVVSHLRCSVWAMGYALVGMKPLAGEWMGLLDRITQTPARITTFSYSKAEGLKILSVNAQSVESHAEPKETPSK